MRAPPLSVFFKEVDKQTAGYLARGIFSERSFISGINLRVCLETVEDYPTLMLLLKAVTLDTLRLHGEEDGEGPKA